MTHPTNEDVARFIEACYRVEAAMPGLRESIREHLAQTEQAVTSRADPVPVRGR